MSCINKFILLAVVLGASSQVCAADELNFSRDILPILSDRCFHCHGPEPTHREAELRLDQRESATADRDGTRCDCSGKTEIK